MNNNNIDKVKAEHLINSFVGWMKDKGHAEATIRGYISSIIGAEKYASEHSLAFDTIITDDLDLCTRSVDGLLHDPKFMK